MLTKSLAIFDRGQTVELPSPIFVMPKPKRGRQTHSELRFPNGDPIPTRATLIAYILQNVLYQIDETVEGPIFCKHLIKCNRERNRQSMYHVVMGAHQWTGVWEVTGNRRMFDVRAVWLPDDEAWVPQIMLSPGNYIGVSRFNGFEMTFKELRRAMIKHEFVTAEEFDCYASQNRTMRYQAITRATRGIWM